jgi:hypothetical protein
MSRTPPPPTWFQVRDSAMRHNSFFTPSMAEAKFWCTIGYTATAVSCPR